MLGVYYDRINMNAISCPVKYVQMLRNIKINTTVAETTRQILLRRVCHINNFFKR